MGQCVVQEKFPEEIIGKEVEGIYYNENDSVGDTDDILLLYFTDGSRLVFRAIIDCQERVDHCYGEDLSSLLKGKIVKAEFKRSYVTTDEDWDDEKHWIFYEITTDKGGTTALSFVSMQNGFYRTEVKIQYEEAGSFPADKRADPLTESPEEIAAFINTVRVKAYVQVIKTGSSDSPKWEPLMRECSIFKKRPFCTGYVLDGKGHYFYLNWQGDNSVSDMPERNYRDTDTRKVYPLIRGWKERLEASLLGDDQLKKIAHDVLKAS